MQKIVPAEALKDYIGQEIGTSDWVTLDQDRINAFADATLDHQFIHVDQEKAAQSPFGGTIAHGFLSLSMLPHMAASCALMPENLVMTVNYGLNKLRFLAPVPSGSEIRSRVRVLDVTPKGAGRYLLTNEITIEIKGGDKPALVVESLMLFFTEQGEENGA